MKEKEFIKQFGTELKQDIYYSLDDNGNVVLDIEGIKDNFETMLNLLEVNTK